MWRERRKKPGIDLRGQVVRPGELGPCGELVLGTCAWGKRRLGGC